MTDFILSVLWALSVLFWIGVALALSGVVAVLLVYAGWALTGM